MKREDLNFYLQQARPHKISALCKRIRSIADVQIIQQPTAQTLMLPVSDPVNQGTFYGGEVLVISVIVRVNNIDGWAMVMDDNQNLALHLAILDAAYAANIEQNAITKLGQEGYERQQADIHKTSTAAASTRVAFDLL